MSRIRNLLVTSPILYHYTTVPTVGEETAQVMDGSSKSNYFSNYILTSKRFEICRQWLRSFTLHFAYDVSSLRLTT